MTKPTKTRRNYSLKALLEIAPGKSVYSELPDKDIQAFASYYGLKIKTERLLAFKAKSPSRLEKLTRVTLTGRKEGVQW